MIEYQTKWFSGRDRMLDWIGARIDEGGAWKFEVIPDCAPAQSGWYVKADPIVEEWTNYASISGSELTPSIPGSELSVCIPDNNTYVVENWDDVPAVPEGVWGCFQIAPAAKEIYDRIKAEEARGEMQD